MAFGLEAIDWEAPWLAPWRVPGYAIASEVASGQNVAQALNAASLAPVQFVPQASLPGGMAYEQFIFASGSVPTRDGLHDFFNGLCWLRFPRTKARLNQLQVAQIAESGIAPVRGPARDAITVFDENAAFFVGPDAVWSALAAKDWATLFGPLRAAWADVQLVLFGHALLEKLVYPRKPITAHVYRAGAAIQSISELDGVVAASLSAEALATKPFAHLPVLGVPGWWPENTCPDFYRDTSVFRAPKMPGKAPA